MSLSSGMTIVELDDLIKSLPKERLQAELEKPTGHFPLYLVAGRLKEIESMTADAQAAAATEKAAEQPPSVAHRLAMMQPPVMSEVAAAPQPQPQPSPAGQAAQMLTPTVNANTGGLISELVNKYLADKKLKGTKDSDSEFAVPNSSGFAGGSSKQPFNKSNPTETGGLASLVAANVIRKERRADPTPDDGGVSKMRAGKGGDWNYDAETINYLYEKGMVVGIKEEHSSLAEAFNFVSQLNKNLDVIVAGGSMRRFCFLNPAGANSFLAGVGNVFPNVEQEFFHNKDNKFISMETQLFKVFMKHGWHQSLRIALRIRGLTCFHDREPWPKASDAAVVDIAEILDTF